MNLALVTSYIIAAMLILSIIMMNLRLSSSSTELALTQITRQHVVTVADMLNDDIPNMGYNVYEKADPILTCAHPHKIRFFRNIQNDPDREPERITWEFFDTPILPNNKNQDIGLLTRTVLDQNTGIEDVTEIRTGVTKFYLRYYEQHGDSLDNYVTGLSCAGQKIENIKQIYLELEMQSAEPLYTRSNSDGRYIRSVYEKRFSPRNLE